MARNDDTAKRRSPSRRPSTAIPVAAHALPARGLSPPNPPFLAAAGRGALIQNLDFMDENLDGHL